MDQQDNLGVVAAAFEAASQALNLSDEEHGQLLAVLTTMPVAERNCYPLNRQPAAQVSFARTYAQRGRRSANGEFRLVAAFVPCRSRSACVAGNLRVLVPGHIAWLWSVPVAQQLTLRERALDVGARQRDVPSTWHYLWIFGYLLRDILFL